MCFDILTILRNIITPKKTNLLHQQKPISSEKNTFSKKSNHALQRQKKSFHTKETSKNKLPVVGFAQTHYMHLKVCFDTLLNSIAVDIFYYFFIFYKLLRYSFQEKRLKKMNLRSTFPSSLQYITLHQIVSINSFCFLLNSNIPTRRSTTIMPKL